jgi:hypothetical protein
MAAEKFAAIKYIIDDTPIGNYSLLSLFNTKPDIGNYFALKQEK